MVLEPDPIALIEFTYATAKENYGGDITSALLREKVGTRFPQIPLARVLEVARASCELLEYAEEVGSKVDAGLLTEDQGLLFLEKTFPGFSKVIYADAYVFGQDQARKRAG